MIKTVNILVKIKFFIFVYVNLLDNYLIFLPGSVGYSFVRKLIFFMIDNLVDHKIERTIFTRNTNWLVEKNLEKSVIKINQ